MPYDILDEDELQRAVEPYNADPGVGVRLPDEDGPTTQTDTTGGTDSDDPAAVQSDALEGVAQDAAADKAQSTSGLDALRQELYQGILQRRAQKDDRDELKRLQLFGLLGQGLGTVASGIARQGAAGYFGGTADPTAVANARANLMAQADTAGQGISQLAQAPVQAYIQRRQQELAGDKLASEDARTLAQVERAAAYVGKGTGKGYTPEQIEAAKQTARAMGIPEEALAGVTPDNLAKLLAESGKNTRATDTNALRARQLDQRLEELDKKLADHRISAAERTRLQNERLDVAKARLNLYGAVASNRAEGDIGQRQVPGVEFDQPISTQTARELVRRKGYTAEAMRNLNELADTLEKVSASGQLDPRSAEYGSLKALYGSLGPKAIAGEFGNSFTEGHAHVIQQMIENPQGFKGWALTPAIAAAARKTGDELDHGFRTAVEQSGGRFITPNPYAIGTPGKTKNYSAAPVRAANAKIKQVTGNAPVHYVSPQNPAGWDIPPDKVKAFEAAHPEAKPSGG